MTPEEKAKAYDKAIAKAQKELQICGSKDCDAARQIYRFFPELKESEDEKMWKLIKKYAHYNISDMALETDHITREQLESWLEKQGKETSWKPSKEEMDVLYSLAYITNQYDEHKEIVITRLYQDLKREFFNGSSYENMFPTNTSIENDVRRRSTIQVLEYARSLDAYNQFGKADIDKNIAWLEKQGKQKHIFNADDWHVSKVDGKIHNIYHTDKAEPKFHEGDWVVYNNDICQIVKREEGCNKLVTVYGIEKELVNERNLSTARLWTIQDAKDGDVLTSGHLVFIFKVIHGVWLNCHCSAHNDGSFIADSYDLMTNKYFSEVHPATKEQRDLLFAKMKEAGYEWDAEKKELKMLEKQGKPKWTDEDEERLQSCIIALQGKGLMGGVDTMDSKWLKSLKQRIYVSSAKTCKNDTLLDLLNKMPSYITVDGLDYHFVLKKIGVYIAYYECEGEEGRDKIIFWMAGEPVDILTEMLEKLKKEGLLE